LGLAALRAAALGALVLLLWNPSAARVAAGGAPPLVLLDASLSMAGHGGRWRGALDTARALARGGIIWRFGERVAGFDTLPPTARPTWLAGRGSSRSRARPSSTPLSPPWTDRDGSRRAIPSDSRSVMGRPGCEMREAGCEMRRLW